MSFKVHLRCNILFSTRKFGFSYAMPGLTGVWLVVLCLLPRLPAQHGSERAWAVAMARTPFTMADGSKYRDQLTMTMSRAAGRAAWAWQPPALRPAPRSRPASALVPPTFYTSQVC